MTWSQARFLTPAALVALVFATSASGLDLHEAFLREAQPQWQRYERFCRDLQGSSTSISRDLDSGQGTRTDAQVKKNARCNLFLVESKRIRPDGNEQYLEGEVRCLNPHYSFVLKRKSPQGPWIVLQVKAASRVLEREESPYAFLMVITPFDLPKLAQEVNFQVTEMSRIGMGAGRYVRLGFRFQPPNSPRHHYRGTLELDPEAAWCVRSAQIQLLLENQVIDDCKILHEYECRNGAPLPRARTQRKEFKTGDGTTERGETFVKVNHSIPQVLPPDAEFYLSAFGLPEPYGFEPPTRWHLWAAAAGVVCLAVAMLVGRWYRRQVA